MLLPRRRFLELAAGATGAAWIAETVTAATTAGLERSSRLRDAA